MLLAMGKKRPDTSKKHFALHTDTRDKVTATRLRSIGTYVLVIPKALEVLECIDC